jgi:hypothetical protein
VGVTSTASALTRSTSETESTIIPTFISSASTTIILVSPVLSSDCRLSRFARSITAIIWPRRFIMPSTNEGLFGMRVTSSMRIISLT